MELTSDSVRRALDAVPVDKKVTGHFATVEITAYPDGHAAIAGHPLNGWEELLASVGYLFDRLEEQVGSGSEPPKGACDAASRHGHVDFEWTRGHVGTYGNERADELAGLARQQALAAAELERAGKSEDG